MFRVAATLGCLAALCALTLAQSAAPAAAPEPPAAAPTPTPVALRSDVYRAQNGNAVNDFTPSATVVHAMVDNLVLNVTGQGSVAAAWGSLVRPSDVVGIKVCANGAPFFSSHPAVVAAICDGLAQAGVPPQNIVVFDRDEELLKEAGYTTRNHAYRLLWNQGNYDSAAVVSSSITGKLIYGDLLFVGRRVPTLGAELAVSDKKERSQNDFSNESHISRILARLVTKVVNVPVMTDHISCGLSGGLYNMTVQNVDNWRRLVQDPVKGDPEIPELYSNPLIGSKVVLTVMDGLIAGYAGAPMGDLNYAVQAGVLLAGRDPVAIDALAVRQIDRWRKEAKMEPASKDAKYISTAFDYSLGNADPNRIDVHEVR
ncbi:MAG TPA: DUF362 domain-containing protein [Chthoniobacterales bacterium]